MAQKKQVNSFSVLYSRLLYPGIFSENYYIYLLAALFLIFLSCAITDSGECGEIFFWTDDQGIRHYSNVEHSSSVKEIHTYTEKDNGQGNSIDINSYQYKNTESYHDRPDVKESPHIKNTQHDKNIISTKNSSGSSGYNKINTAENTLSFRVLKIYDGDSMKVAGSDLTLMIRLVGIDAPESGRNNQTSKKSLEKKGSSYGGQPFSLDAKEALIRMIGKREIRIKSYGTDRYNRLLAEVFTADGTLANLELVRLGMAEVYRGLPPKDFDIAPYKKAESEAKSRYLGIWSTGTRYQSPKVWRKQHPRK